MSEFPSAAPKPPPEAPRASIQRIEYLSAIRFAAAHPEWLINLLLFGLCLLIPVLGALVQFGYCYGITELQHRNPRTVYPKFDFNQFAAYVTRGVWPFLCFFIAQSLVMVVYQVLFQSTMFGTMAAFSAGNETGTIVAAVVIPTVIIGFLVLILAVMLVMRPLMLRAGLSQDFAATAKFAWLGDYLRRMWLETLLVNIFTMLFAILLAPVGLLLCCIGSVLTSGFVAITGAHLDWQLYELYLARGGEPIPLKPLPADVPPVVTPTP